MTFYIPRMHKTITSAALALVAASAQGATLLSDWDSSLDLGLTLTRGNSDTSLFTTNYKAQKKVDQDEYFTGIGYTFGQDTGSTITDELTGFFNWNRLVSDSDYFGLKLEGRKDAIANIDYRLQGSALYGHYFIKNDTTNFSVEGGPGFTTVSLGGVETNTSHVYVGEKASHKLTDNTNLTQSFSGYASLDDLDRYNMVFNIGVDTAMSESMSLKVFLENKYESTPAAGSTNNDLRLVSGISYKF